MKSTFYLSAKDHPQSVVVPSQHSAQVKIDEVATRKAEEPVHGGLVSISYWGANTHTIAGRPIPAKVFYQDALRPERRGMLRRKTDFVPRHGGRRMAGRDRRHPGGFSMLCVMDLKDRRGDRSSRRSSLFLPPLLGGRRAGGNGRRKRDSVWHTEDLRDRRIRTERRKLDPGASCRYGGRRKAAFERRRGPFGRRGVAVDPPNRRVGSWIAYSISRDPRVQNLERRGAPRGKAGRYQTPYPKNILNSSSTII